MLLLDHIITLLSFVRRPAKRQRIKEAFKLRGLTGLEIGGPSAFFRSTGGMPVYPFAKRIDGVNFSNETIWEGRITEGFTYWYFRNKKGRQFIAEATDLATIKDNVYDFVLSCHSLEHVANPLKALKEWHRVLKTGGTLVVVVPDRRFTFDHKRSYTTYEHLLSDYKNDTGENDTAHFDEILQTHDPLKTGLTDEEIALLLKDNHANRRAHHHVFNHETLQQMFKHAGFQLQSKCTAPPFHLIAVGKKER